MAAICGIVNFDEGAARQDELEPMMKALAYHGPGGVHALHLNLSTGECPGQIPPPSCDSSGRYPSHLAIVFNARLDNRQELFQKLSIESTRQRDFMDGDLILTAYEKWGERCPEFLLGDFAFALWDGRHRRLFCCRDHLGQRPLFYYGDGRRFIFASEPKAIAAIPGVARLVNRNKLVTLAYPTLRSHFWEQTWFEDVYAVQAGTSLTFDVRGIRRRRYWEPRLTAELPDKSDDEILEAFRELLFDVVSARLRGPSQVAALLSGGLDSSTIVSVAARVLERSNRELHALSSVLPDPNDPLLRDERHFIDQFRSWANVRINYVAAPRRGPFDDLEELVWSCDSPLITSRHYLYTAFAEAARERGARVILDGAGGELGPSFYGGGYYAELLLQGRWPTLWREMRLRQKVSGDPLWRSFRADVVHPLLPTALLDRLRPRVAEDIVFDRQQPLQTRFIESQLTNLGLKTRVSSRHDNRIPPKHKQVQCRSLLLAQRKSSRVGGFVGHEQVEMRFPFMDKRMLEFCLSAPGRLKVRNGHTRYLIRAGLEKILPPSIQWRTTKEPFSPDYLRRYNAQRQAAQTILEGIHRNDPVRAVVDVDKLKSLAVLPVSDNENGTFAQSAALHSVPTGIYLICFLRRFDEFRN